PSTGTTNSNGNDVLFAVTCAAGSDCWALGQSFQSIYYKQTLTQHWDGTSWTIIPSPNHLATVAFNSLSGVTCLSTSQCWTVGYYIGDGLVNRTVTKYWNGISWAIVPSPNTGVADEDNLSAVTCISASNCWAVGEYSPPVSNSNTLTEHWDGATWSIVSSPSVTGDALNGNNGNFL